MARLNGQINAHDPKMNAGPFLLKLFYRTGAFHRPDEFAAVDRLTFVPVHTFSTCSLVELSHFLAAAQTPAVLPSPAIGTRIAFRLVRVESRDAYEEGAAHGRSEPRIVVRDLGSVIVGGDGPGAPATLSSLEAIDNVAVEEEDFIDDNGHQGTQKSGHKTLADAYYAVGDYISCAILPPLANGCVAPASDARSGRGTGVGEAPPSRGPPPPAHSRLSSRTGSRYSDSRAGKKSWYAAGEVTNYGVPTGDWRRGDVVPDAEVWLRDGGRGRLGSGGEGRGDRKRRRSGGRDQW